MANLACTYHDQGRWNEAEQLQVQVVDMRHKVLGAQHPDTVESIVHLTQIKEDKQRWST